MKNRLRKEASVILSLLLIGNGTVGCRGDLSATDNSSSSSTVSVGAGAVTTSGTVSSDGFWVKPYFDPNNAGGVYDFYLHEQSSAFSSANCKVTQGSATKGIYCYLDVNELDLYFNGMSLVFNTPTGMCSYSELQLYDFYALPAGYYNPPAVTIAKDAAGSVTSVKFTSSGAAVPAAGANAVPLNAAATVPICPFDYSPSGGPNCCQGNYAVTLVVPGNPITSITGSFGGDISNCIVGPGKDYKALKGYPVAEVFRTSITGNNVKVTMAAPISKTLSSGLRYSSNLYLANYFNPVSFGDAGFTSWPTTSPFWPSAIRGNVVGAASTVVGSVTYAFTNGTSYMAAPGSLLPYYQYKCLDPDYEVLAQLRLFIRSWDTLAGWTAQSNPYNNTPETGFPEYPNHDFNVWQDFLNTFPGSSL